MESLVAIAMILSFLSAVMYLEKLYTAKMAVIDGARLKSWIRAVRCDNKESPTPPPEMVKKKTGHAQLDNSPDDVDLDNSHEEQPPEELRIEDDEPPDWLKGDLHDAITEEAQFGDDRVLKATRQLPCNEREETKQLELHVPDYASRAVTNLWDSIF